ncbi:hypothetical protein DL768_005495 [Monosporascus sp. mg162]|nr:hypothetical protein DL768_005495 [Monosporascus sp. mg162]
MASQVDKTDPNAEEKLGAAHLEGDQMAKRGELLDLVNDAQIATEKERSMTLLQGLKLYPKAIGWSVLFSTAIIMEGYDVVLMASLFAFPTFKERYGNIQPDGSYELPANWQAGLQNAMAVGQFVGLFFNGVLCDRFGYRKTMMGCLSLCVAFIFVLFFAPNKPALLLGEFFLGIPLGAFQSLSVTYAAEVCPVVLRSYLTTYVNLCWLMGQILASGVLRALLSRTDQWGYRIPFALQWAWPVPIAIGCLLAPESPWWLVRAGRMDEARSALKRLASSDTSGGDYDPTETIAMMVHTNEMEMEANSGTSYLDCFRGTDLRRTEIACCTWAAQNLCGAGLMGYSTYFYKAAGLPDEQAFSMSLALYAIGIVGTLLSWVFMSYLGRRTLYVGGLWALFAVLMIVGFISLAPATGPDGINEKASWATGSMLLVFAFIYDGTVGPVCFSLVSEMPSTRLRNKTTVLARNLYNVVNITNGIIPYMLNPTAWDWGGKAGFFWGGFCFVSAIWAFFRLPEPKGRTFAELDVLFEKKINARKFKTTVVSPFQARAEEKVVEED